MNLLARAVIGLTGMGARLRSKLRPGNVSASAFVLAALVAGCSTQPSHSPVLPCPDVLVGENLVAPAPGSTDVPVDVGALYVTAPADGMFTLVAAGGTIAAGRATSIPSPRPSDAAFASLAAPVPTLSPATRYTVHYAAPRVAAGACANEVSDDIGSFTTR